MGSLGFKFSILRVHNYFRLAWKIPLVVILPWNGFGLAKQALGLFWVQIILPPTSIDASNVVAPKNGHCCDEKPQR